MSSAPSTRRLKDTNGAAAGHKPVKPLTPVSSMSSKSSNLSLQKSASGRENPRSSHRGFGSSQKPSIRPVPRVEKAEKWSTSSVPRGRSSSPSEFIRVFSDFKKEKGSRVNGDRGEMVSAGRGSVSRNSGVKRVDNGAKIITDDKENGEVGDLSGKSKRAYEELAKKGEKRSDLSSDSSKVSSFSSKSSRVSEESGKEVEMKSNLSSDSRKVGSFSGSGMRGDSDSNSKLDAFCGSEEKSGSVLKSDSEIGKIVKGVSLSSNRTSLDGNVKVPEISREKGVGEGSSSRVGNKSSSKLHEKLAFLEGKVKRIASDIKKTKDMLDMNNPDASKVILSDIQEKISGIEKAMSHAVSDSGSKIGASKKKDNEEKKISEKSEINQSANAKCPVKGLNSEELEDRLFPHHKLLRNRTQLKASSGTKTHETINLTDSRGEIKLEEKPLALVEENPIALEFLASLEKENPKVTISHNQADLKHSEIQETDLKETSSTHDSSKPLDVKPDFDEMLTADETLEDELTDAGNTQEVYVVEEIEDSYIYQLNEMGQKTSTGGWFVSEGDAALLAHDDGSCSYYDVANCEVKSVYNPPAGISPNIWRDCWIVRAPGADGCSGRYVVAASAGNTLGSGFCSWDFYTKKINAYHFEDGASTPNPRAVLAPLPNNTLCNRNAFSCTSAPETQQWWYRPCGPLIISTASSQKVVKVFDIRDGEQIMRWEVQKPVSAVDYSSPLQWRNRGKIVIAEAETVSVWDVNSQHPEALQSISSLGRKISAIHVNNTDAELGGGVRQRVSSSEAEGSDGVFCTADSINVLDLRTPSGIGAKIPKLGVHAQSIFSRGDLIFLGCTNLRSTTKKQLSSHVQQFSLRKQRVVSTFSLPESNTHSHHSAITQVWGNSNFVMAISGMGLFVFDSAKDESLQSLMGDYGSPQKVRETIGPDDMYSPSFDYVGARVLLISRDRPAQWRHLL